MQTSSRQSDIGSLRSNDSDTSLPDNQVRMHGGDSSSSSPHRGGTDYADEKANLDTTTSNGHGQNGNQLNRLKNKDYVVPRNERRGLLPQLAIIPEFKDARDYPPMMKKMIVFLIAFSSMMGPMGTSIIFPAINAITTEYKTPVIMVNVSIGVYLLSLGVFPLWWSSLSELEGRRTTYITSFALLFAFSIGSALAPDINSFIALRMLCGAASASVQSVGAGTVADLYISEDRGKNLSYYYLGPLLAPLLSPIIGSLLVNRWPWRSTQWFMVILSGCNVILLTVLLPETLRKQDSKSAIAQILAERRVQIDRNKYGEGQENYQPEEEDELEQTENRIASLSTEKHNYVREVDGQDSLDLESPGSHVAYDGPSRENQLQRIYTEASRSMYEYQLDDSGIDATTAQVTRIRSTDPKLARSIRENSLRKLQTNLEEQVKQVLSKNGSEIAPREISAVRKCWDTFFVYFIKPLKSLYFLQYPPVALAITFSAISFSTVYFVNMTVEYKYSRPPYNFKPLYIGLLYIPNSITYLFASIYGGRWVDMLLKRYKEKYGILAPEARISWNVVTSVISFPIALLIFGWCLDKKCHWVTPLIGTALFGYAAMMTIGATLSYLVDSLPGKGATGVALNNLIRQILAATAVFVTTPMINGMGTGWAFTMLAFIVLGASSVLVILKKHGDYWRENYDLQRLYDKVD
ncbi:Qdr3p [Saccharomyces eubayanus]|uniref:Qdr3p n=1 Tax=Saccharomyces eubayanus TaxID=1080349 RepID=UPI0006BF03C2|nr:QDR3-like protein [Saccharomyces eubayanus]KOH00367.1 QDR3-like protein [Saccharomyces eubayanus]